MKRIMMLSLCLLLIAALLGCSAQAEKEKTLQQEGVIQSAVQTEGTTVYGKVEKIVGNEVVLALGEPERSTASSMGGRPNGTTGEGEASQGDVSGGERPQVSEGVGTRPSGGQMPSGGSGERSNSGQMPSGNFGERPSGNVTFENGQSLQAGGTLTETGRSVTLTYSGETGTFLLPVGMAIGAGDFSNVSKGMVLALSLDGEEMVTAVRILAS